MSLTYILQIDGPGNLVKFGRTVNPTSRIASIRTGLPWPCRIVALIGSDIEADLKRRYADHKVQGEWFKPSPELRDELMTLARDGKLVRQVTVDQAYINAAIKPRIKEYLNGREPTNSSAGDLVRCIFADILPSLQGREAELTAATKGHVTNALCRGFGPTTELPVLHLADEAAAHTEQAA